MGLKDIIKELAGLMRDDGVSPRDLVHGLAEELGVKAPGDLQVRHVEPLTRANLSARANEEITSRDIVLARTSIPEGQLHYARRDPTSPRGQERWEGPVDMLRAHTWFKRMDEILRATAGRHGYQEAQIRTPPNVAAAGMQTAMMGRRDPVPMILPAEKVQSIWLGHVNPGELFGYLEMRLNLGDRTVSYTAEYPADFGDLENTKTIEHMVSIGAVPFAEGYLGPVVYDFTASKWVPVPDDNKIAMVIMGTAPTVFQKELADKGQLVRHPGFPAPPLIGKYEKQSEWGAPVFGS